MYSNEEFNKIVTTLNISQEDLPMNPNLENLSAMIYKKRITKQLEISELLLELSINIEKQCIGDMSIDCAYLCKITLLRLINHFKICLNLAKNSNSDINLISRSMFEGGLYFFYLCHDQQKIREWRLYSCVETQKSITLAKQNNEEIPQDLLKMLEPYKVEMDNTFRKQNGKYHSSWKKGMSIKDMASKTPKFEKLYNDYYTFLSDYHHWGISSLAYHFQITTDGHNIVAIDSKPKFEMISKALDLANSSLYSILEASINIFHLECFTTKLSQIMEEFLKIPFAKKY